MNIGGPVYIERIQSQSIRSVASLKVTAGSLALNFEIRRFLKQSDFKMQWEDEFVDNYASKHVEKWVERIGSHLRSYVFTSRPGLPGVTPPYVITPKGNVQPLKLNRKSFSGDVSGSIAEALFAMLLLRRYQLGMWDFVHLRAVSQSGRAPDFSISRLTPNLISDLNPPSPYVAVPVVAEVKGATGADLGSISSKFEDALSQVEKLRGVGSCGLACVFLRDSAEGKYHGMMVVVQP